LARVDAWEHCYTQAEASYRAWLERAPNDVEAVAGLFDVLLWTDRLDEAQRTVERALQANPQAPELLRRRALVYMRHDQPANALHAAEQALARTPDDPELQALRDRIFLSQLRAYARWDRYFGDYPDLHSFGLAYWQRLSRFELSLDALLVERSGGALPKAIVDAQYALGVGYHFSPLATLGGVFAFGAPAKALPTWIAKLWLSSQWSALVGTHISYAMWDYKGEKTVHIVAPVITFTPNEQLSIDLRYYGTLLVLHQPDADPPRYVNTVAGRAVTQLTAAWRLGLSYTYGAQLDQAALSDIISFRSHVLSLFSEYRPRGRWGLQPLLSVERRAIRERVVWIGSLELGAYVRW
jgi:tetratricopeptide (TPR) repeat protein